MSRDQSIVRAAIHPAIGVSRVGNSDDYFVGPQVTPFPEEPPGFYRDGDGNLKRQAALFRIYGYDADGAVVRELTADDATIRWSAHVANTKAAWYQWVLALDIPEAATTQCPRRNADIEGADRSSLVIDGGEITIEGRETYGDAFAFKGHFLGAEVALGALQTDAAGRLLFLPGRGVSASPTDAPIYDEEQENAFINANGWYDDVCDGPVTAEVVIDGQSIPCDAAWVLSAPPDYAPNVQAVRTLYDLLQNLFIEAGLLSFPSQISFRHDVYPILARLTTLQWVNRGFSVQYGLDGPYPFGDPTFIARLASLAPERAELRRQVLNAFRDPENPGSLQLPWAWIYGDAMEVPAGDSPRQNAAVSPTQYRILQLWAAGSFVDDWNEGPPPARRLEDLPLAEQPAMLDRAALEYCLADAFHPGCEVTWPIRHLTMFDAPFRFKHRPAGDPAPDYGPVLDQEIALSADGPLHAQGPGDLTRWMGLPWQADTAYCRSGYDQKYDPYIPTFWPATVPNQVLTEQAYEVLMNATDPAERQQAFEQRAAWVRLLVANGPSSTAGQMETMVRIFGSMGVVEPRKGPDDDPNIPATVMVESIGPGVSETPPVPAERAALKVAADAAEVSAATLLREALPDDTGWASADEAAQAPLPVSRRRE